MVRLYGTLPLLMVQPRQSCMHVADMPKTFASEALQIFARPCKVARSCWSDTFILTDEQSGPLSCIDRCIIDPIRSTNCTEETVPTFMPHISYFASCSLLQTRLFFYLFFNYFFRIFFNLSPRCAVMSPSRACHPSFSCRVQHCR